MIRFADKTLIPYIRQSGYRKVCEVGASYGETADKLLEIGSLQYDIVDPCLDADLAGKYRERPNVRVHQGLSLDILPTLSERFHCILLDGDHNWYTVYHELHAIHSRNLLEPGGTVFFHDVGFPYGRRDMYYQPETIPAEYLQPYAQQGILNGQSALSAEAGYNSGHYNATHEGGERNGVLTAIEDFLKENEDEYLFCYLKEEHGLGVMYKPTDSAPASAVYNRLARHARYVELAANVKNAVKHVPGVYPMVRKASQYLRKHPGAL